MNNQSFISRMLNHSAGRQISVLIAFIFMFEYFTMLVIDYFLPKPVMFESLIDFTFLAILLTPIGYYLFIRPMNNYQRQKKLVEKALEQSEERYRNIVETLYGGILLEGTKGEILFTNKRFSEMLGYPTEEIIGHFRSEFIYRKNHKNNQIKGCLI